MHFRILSAFFWSPVERPVPAVEPLFFGVNEGDALVELTDGVVKYVRSIDLAVLLDSVVELTELDELISVECVLDDFASFSLPSSLSSPSSSSSGLPVLLDGALSTVDDDGVEGSSLVVVEELVDELADELDELADELDELASDVLLD